MKILIVDDSQPVVELLELLLAGPDVEIFSTLESLEAVGLMMALNPDLIISDVNMPRMNGIDLSFEIRKAHSNVPIILFSAQLNGHEIHRKDLERIGNVTYIENKSISELMETVRAFKMKLLNS